jgi:hypothetical protein
MDGETGIDLGVNSHDPENRRRLPTIARILSHGTVWVAVLVPTAVVLSKGWVAIGDDAAIAIRSFQTFSVHPPLVGMYSTAGSGPGHYLYDPGPLLFWLLAVPVHIDPTRGLLWGAALSAGGVLSLAIEAIWRTKLWIGCVVVAFATADLLLQWPGVFENLAWNAYFPIPFLIAAIGLAWVVGTGSFGWWPVLVFVASVAAQGHLIFFVIAVVLAVLSPVIGMMLAGKPKRLRWLTIGLVVAFACWSAPILQSFGSHGNLTALFHGTSGQKSMGIAFGLRMMATAGSPSPVWLRHSPSGYFGVLHLVESNSPLLGLFVLILLVVIALMAWRQRNRYLCALSLIALVCSISVTVTFAVYPTRSGLNLDYLIPLLWIVGILVWTAVVWSGALTLSALVRRISRSDTLAASNRHAPTGSIVLSWILFGVVVAFGLAGLVPLWSFQPNESNIGASQAGMASIVRVSRSIERASPKGPVLVTVDVQDGDLFSALWMTEGIDWQLEADGWHPGANAIERAFTDLVPMARSVHILVMADRQGPVSFTRTYCRQLSPSCLIGKD